MTEHQERMIHLEIITSGALLTLLGLLLGLRSTFLLAMYDETGPGFLFVPFEAG